MHSIVVMIATFFYSGLAPKAPGTFGTFASSLVLIGLYYAGLPVSAFSSFYAGIFLCSLYVIGWTVTHFYIKKTGKHDPKEVVIDETLGIYSSYAFFFYVFPETYVNSSLFLFISLVLFITFRFFDIVKPFPVSFFDKRMDNAHGVMLDDVMAGIYAGAVCTCGYYFYLLSLS